MLRTGRFHGGMMLLTTVGATLVLGTGCSLKKDDKSRLHVGLAGFKKYHGNSVLDKSLNGLTELAIGVSSTSDISNPSGVKSVFDMECFAINVRGGIIPTYGMCDNNINVGIAESPQYGLSATFSPIVPASSGVIFEAFGSPPGECPNINGEGDPGTVYKIGEVTADLTQDISNLTIPVAFDVNKAFDCSREPYDVFYEDFDYNQPFSTPLTDANAGYDYWDDDAGLYGPLEMDGDQITADIGTANRINFTAFALDDAIFTRLQLYVDGTNVAGAENLNLRIGLSDFSDSSVGTSALYCAYQGTKASLFYTGSGWTNANGINAAAMLTPDGPGSYTNGSATFSGHYMLCDIYRNSDGTVEVYTGLFDENGDAMGTPSVATFGSDPCPDCNVPFINMDTSAFVGSTSFSIDDFLIQQSDVE